jgi:hypothetical protein
MISTSMLRRFLALLAVPAAGACAALGSAFDGLGERPPSPLDEATVASDARLDSAGALLGSFIGEGTSRQVHLLSSDTALIGELARRYRPANESRGDVWRWLSGRRTFAINLDPVKDAALLDRAVMVGSPAGHTQVDLATIILHGSSCGARGAQAEFVVVPRRSSGPSLRGPVVGSFLEDRSFQVVRRMERRDPVEEPADELVDSLLAWTADAMDSLLEARLPARDRPLARPAGRRLELNGLADDEAADVLAFRLDDGRVRYAVSLRDIRRTGRGTDVLASIVMVWDANGAWRQVVFRPTLLEYRRGRRYRPFGGITGAHFWRRLAPVSGFAFGRDYLWMEQVNVSDGSVLWVVLEPRGNTVVAAAEMEGPCS